MTALAWLGRLQVVSETSQTPLLLQKVSFSSLATLVARLLRQLFQVLAAKVDQTIQIATSGSLDGGGNLSASRTLSLSGDSAAPGNGKYYGTNASGTKGYYILPAGSGPGVAVIARTTAYTAVNGDFVIANATSGGFTITMPPVASGATLSVKKVDSSVNAIIVQPQGGELIDDQVTISVNTQRQSNDFLSDGTKWYRI
jgi:hypothetical protein